MPICQIQPDHQCSLISVSDEEGALRLPMSLYNSFGEAAHGSPRECEIVTSVVILSKNFDIRHYAQNLVIRIPVKRC